MYLPGSLSVSRMRELYKANSLELLDYLFDSLGPYIDTVELPLHAISIAEFDAKNDGYVTSSKWSIPSNACPQTCQVLHRRQELETPQA
ncbi:hypothetical protein BDW74DRAFT_143459 [Aspergillus multicolor]|uniref:uncharacterized protein n=1 Tax=Aspergillus multicolor TaxID=41759 RepID=UPI003CCE220F